MTEDQQTAPVARSPSPPDGWSSPPPSADAGSSAHASLWRTIPTREPGPGVLSRRQRSVAVVIGVLLFLAGLLSAWVLALSTVPAPFFLTIPMTEYTARQFPPLAFAEQDSDLLCSQYSRHRKAFNSQQSDLLKQEVEGLRGHREHTLLVHLRAHALTRKGQVYVVAGNGSPDTTEDLGVTLEAVLDALERCPSRHKLLLLDLMGPLADTRLGQLEDLAVRVETMLQSRPASQLMILCACQRGQTAHVSEQLGQSAFASFIDEGLRGPADGYGPGGLRNGRVSVRNLGAYAHDKVDLWAVANRGEHQMPRLYGNDPDDFVVKVIHPGVAPPVRPELASYPDWLRSGWELHDRYRRDNLWEIAPHTFQTVGAVLLRAEQNWRGGREPGLVRSTLEADLAGLKDRIDRARALASLAPAEPGPEGTPLHSREIRSGPQPRSLASLRPAINPTTAGELHSLLIRLPSLPAKEAEKEPAEFLGKLKEKLTFPQWAALLLAEANSDETPPEKSRLLLLQRLLRGFPGGEQPTLVETLLLERLAAWPVDASSWPTDAVRFLLHAVRDEERAVWRLSGPSRKYV